MVKCFFAILCASFFNLSFGQIRTIRPSIISGFISFANFKNGKSLSSLDPGLDLSYTRGITPFFDLSLTTRASFTDKSSINYTPNKKSLFIENDLSLRIKPSPKNKKVMPFITSGIGIGVFRGICYGYGTTGLGIEITAGSTFLTSKVEYRQPASLTFASHFYVGVGVGGIVSRSKRRKPPQKLPPIQSFADRDGDSITDSIDLCPDQPGLAIYGGCPDRDGDGMIDKIDSCPAVFGFVRYHGCPIPDTDNDGIEDEKDHCPTVAGTIEYDGCPYPDSDFDGVADKDDSCKTIAGTSVNKGCPGIDTAILSTVLKASKNIFFATNQYMLLANSFSALDTVVTILKLKPAFKLTIEGHTDGVGKENANQLLSERRAEAVRTYLEQKGISQYRLLSVGYGSNHPLTTNVTKAGRSRNRRVVLKLRL